MSHERYKHRSARVHPMMPSLAEVQAMNDYRARRHDQDSAVWENAQKENGNSLVPIRLFGVVMTGIVGAFAYLNPLLALIVFSLMTVAGVMSYRICSKKT